jgi:hypothetical protein
LGTKEFSISKGDESWFVLVRRPYRAWEAIDLPFESEAIAELAMSGLVAAWKADGGDARTFRTNRKVKDIQNNLVLAS